MEAFDFALMIKTIPLSGGRYRSDWQTKERQGYVLTRPPPCAHKRAFAELVALQAVTGLIRPLKSRDFQERRAIGLSAREILETISGSAEFAYLRRYVRFLGLSLGDLPIEVMRLADWPSVQHSGFMEALEVVRNDSWDDLVNFPGQLNAAPTIHVINVIREKLRTHTYWKAWSTLYQTAASMIRLPSREAPSGVSPLQQLFCPKYGWILSIRNGRIIGIRSSLPCEQKMILELLMVRGSDLDKRSYTSAACYAIESARDHVERMRILDAFICALPSESRRFFVKDEPQGGRNLLQDILEVALAAAKDQAERGSIFRLVLQAMPVEESHINMPDGKRTLVTGHLIDRLMTRFNMRSVLTALRWLHKHAQQLRPVELPALVQVSKGLNYNLPAIHWRHSNQWTIVTTGDGVAMTIYFPRLDVGLTGH